MKSNLPNRDNVALRADTISKLSILEKWARTGIPWVHGRRVLDFFPTSRLQFSSWDGTQNCEGTRALYPELCLLTRTSRAILVSHPDLLARLDAILQEVSLKQRAQLEAHHHI